MRPIAFLDIETSWEKTITIIGIYRSGQGTIQLIAPEISRPLLLEALAGIEQLFTYNGTGFDLRVIQQHLGVHLAEKVPHRDLMYDCWKRKLKGGLKGVERTLGIHRDTDGVDGLQAMNLWAAHQKGNREALELLLRYNREDCENLEILARKLGILPLLPTEVSGEGWVEGPKHLPSPPPSPAYRRARGNLR
jgi:uncharacterized protein